MKTYPDTHDDEVIVMPDDADNATPKLRSTGAPSVKIIRTLWLTVIGVSMVAVFVTAAGAALQGGSEQWSEEVSAADLRQQLNEDSATGAPQQSVVNGWHTTDLLEIQIEQTADHLALAQGLVTLALLLGLGLLGDRALSLWDRPSASGAAPSSPAEPADVAGPTAPASGLRSGPIVGPAGSATQDERHHR
ncbi:hypothetical protein Q7C18_01330 [Nesterenkonia sp. CL21]|uniref:hypothetical protein n=1 Tax=Nesterenkonia sp. CL21 TaxID=3064894 RepID=UPI00287AE96A|nr:hypothetical protein [Nesterenkonia sp. CL21]MDS2171338.1 hypothetical protein [Nesterenkonia sp. CL21]